MQCLTQARGGLRRQLWLAAALVFQSVLSLAHAAPTVSLTSPGDTWAYNAPANLPLRATATADPGTTITRVEFYANGTLVGQDATASYATKGVRLRLFMQSLSRVELQG